MKKFIPAFCAILFAFCSFISLPAFADSQGNMDSIAERIDLGVSAHIYRLPKKPTAIEYDVDQYSYYIGIKDMFRVFLKETESTIAQDTTTRRFSTSSDMREAGFFVSARLPHAPEHFFSIGSSQKKTTIDTIYRYINQGACTFATCFEILNHQPVHSNPFYFEYSYDAPGPWKYGFGYTFEEIKLNNANNWRVETKIYSLNVAHEWPGNLETKLTLASHNSTTDISAAGSRQPEDNLFVELETTWKPWQHSTIFLTLGYFNNGVPNAGNPYSGPGGMFVFDYIEGNSWSNTLYTDRFGYIALGAELAL